MKKLDTLIKELIRKTPKKYWTDTMNLLLMCVGARKAYLNDMRMPIESMPKMYREAFLKVCEACEFIIWFMESGSWMVLNSRAGLKIPPSSDKEVGDILGFPCEWRPYEKIKNKIGIDFIIETEHDDTIVTSFFCLAKERAAYMSWFENMKNNAMPLKGFFKKFEMRLESRRV